MLVKYLLQLPEVNEWCGTLTLGRQTSFILTSSERSVTAGELRFNTLLSITHICRPETYGQLEAGVLEKSAPSQPFPAGVIKSSSLNLMIFTDCVSPQFPRMTPDSDSHLQRLLYSHCLGKNRVTKITLFVLHGGKNVIWVLETKLRKYRLNLKTKIKW